MATLLERRSTDIDVRGRAAASILHSVPHAAADALAAAVQSVVAWASDEAGTLRWRVDTIRTGQSLEYGRGVPDAYIDEVRDRALIAAFVPSGVDFDRVYEMWMIAKAEAIGRDLGERYLTGEEVSSDLYALRYRADYEIIAAGFFNTIDDESTAHLPRNLDGAVWQGSLPAEDAMAALQRYAHLFAAATRSGGLDFTVDDLFTRDDPLAELNDKYAAALLFTAPGISAEWLAPAATQIVVGEPYLWWITSPEVATAVIRGLANNPDVAAQVLTKPQALDCLLQRSTLLDSASGQLIGELLLAASTQTDDALAAAQTVAATIAALGSGAVHPRDEVLPYLALSTGSYMDELAWSLSDSFDDPTYSPRFEVSRATARVFVGEVIRNTEAYAVLLAASETWIRDIIVPAEATTFEEYTTWIQNKTDDVGRLLATIISADEIIAIDEAAEQARRQAMLLDSIKALAQVGAEFTGPAKVALGASTEFVHNRADELLDNDYTRDAQYENQLFQEEVLDELDRALYEVLAGLDLVSEAGDLSPEGLALEEGAMRGLIRALITTELLAYTIGDFRPDD